MPCCDDEKKNSKPLLLLLPPLDGVAAAASSFLSFVFVFGNAIPFLFSFAAIEKKKEKERGSEKGLG